MLKFAAVAATLVTDQVVQTRVCCVSVPVYNFNPNSPNACVCVCVSVAESVSSPNSPGSPTTSELAKCQSPKLSRQMPNLILMPDPIILGKNPLLHPHNPGRQSTLIGEHFCELNCKLYLRE